MAVVHSIKHLTETFLNSMLSLPVVVTVLVGVMAFLLLTRRFLSSGVDDSSTMSSDTVSSSFPDRPIRPLPKRRLRERLSPEVADTIRYPPSPDDNAPLFYYPPYTPKEAGASQNIDPASPSNQGRRNEHGRNYTPRRNGTGSIEVDEDGAAPRSTLAPRSPPESSGPNVRRPSRPDRTRPANSQPPPTAPSSADSYDSFENTNNKKKRKIPSAGDSILISSTHMLNTEISSLTISAGMPTTEVSGERAYSHSSTYPGTGSFISGNHSVSGPGRGRFGRPRNARSPLRALSDANNNWAGRAPKSAQWAPSGKSLFAVAFALWLCKLSWCLHFSQPSSLTRIENARSLVQRCRELLLLASCLLS